MTGDLREARIRALLPLVRHAARRVHRMVPACDVEDLVGDGCVGLIRAVDAFDPSRGIPIEHYARKIIVGAILNGVRRMDPVNERKRRTIRLARNARYALAQELGTLPTHAAMARRFPGLAAARAEVTARTPLSLDTPLAGGDRGDVDRSADPLDVVVGRLDRKTIYDAIGELPRRQRRIVLAHYFGEHKLRALTAPMGISPQRVSQLHQLALRRLRKTLEEAA
jgi:RNA polymerase sigma factor FliA